LNQHWNLLSLATLPLDSTGAQVAIVLGSMVLAILICWAFSKEEHAFESFVKTVGLHLDDRSSASGVYRRFPIKICREYAWLERRNYLVIELRLFDPESGGNLTAQKRATLGAYLKTHKTPFLQFEDWLVLRKRVSMLGFTDQIRNELSEATETATSILDAIYRHHTEEAAKPA
jgi:hypothetical protein